jgi:hypothetical protein
MDIADLGNAAVAATQGQSQGVQADVQVAVLKKALDQQASAAAQLIASIPSPPPLAAGGSLGTRVNTFA